MGLIFACGSMGISDSTVALILLTLAGWATAFILMLVNIILLQVLKGSSRSKTANWLMVMTYAGLTIGLFTGAFGGLTNSNSKGTWAFVVFTVPIMVIGHSTYLFLTYREQRSQVRREQQSR